MSLSLPPPTITEVHYDSDDETHGPPGALFAAAAAFQAPAMQKVCVCVCVCVCVLCACVRTSVCIYVCVMHVSVPLIAKQNANTHNQRASGVEVVVGSDQARGADGPHARAAEAQLRAPALHQLRVAPAAREPNCNEQRRHGGECFQEKAENEKEEGLREMRDGG